MGLLFARLTFIGAIVIVLATLTSVCAQEVQDRAQSKTVRSSVPSERNEEANEPLNSQNIAKWVGQGKFGYAIERVDSALKANPSSEELNRLDFLLVVSLGNSKPDLAYSRSVKLVDRLLQLDDLSAKSLVSLANATIFRFQFERDLGAVDRLRLLDSVMARFKEKPDVLNSEPKVRLLAVKVSLLVTMGRQEEGKRLFEPELNLARKQIDESKKETVARFTWIATQYLQSLGIAFLPDVESIGEEAKVHARSLLSNGQVTQNDFGIFYTLCTVQLKLFLFHDSPREAARILSELCTEFRVFKSRLYEGAEAIVKDYEQDIARLSARVATLLLRGELIGTPAPDFNAENFVGTDFHSMKSLKGKVLLVFFCAIWSEPCLASLPALRALNEKYAERGLVILATTGRYNYRWDAHREKPVRSSDRLSISADQELDMLKKFGAKNQLPFGFVVQPSNSTYALQFTVDMLPTAAVIDKAGNIQLIRSGGSENDLKAIETKILELLER